MPPPAPPPPSIAVSDENRPEATLTLRGRPFHLGTGLDSRRLHPGVESHEAPPDLPLDADDPRMRAYFSEIKRRVEANWIYPPEAVRQKQSGSGVITVTVKRDGLIGAISIGRSTGSDILDRYMENAIRLASPFPSIPCQVTEEAIPVTLNFRYTLPGVTGASPTP